MASTDCGADGPGLLVERGPTLYVRIGFDPGFRRGSVPALAEDTLPALVDTGAFASCIDSDLARNLDLPIVNRGMVAGVLGAGEVNFHLAQIYVPELSVTINGRFAGVHLAVGGQPHVALLGRTFLRRFTMRYDGRTGSVTLSDD